MTSTAEWPASDPMAASREWRPLAPLPPSMNVDVTVAVGLKLSPPPMKMASPVDLNAGMDRELKSALVDVMAKGIGAALGVVGGSAWLLPPPEWKGKPETPVRWLGE